MCSRSLFAIVLAIVVSGEARAQQVAAPTIAPVSGSASTPFEAVLNCSTPGARIHYTINTADPTNQDPSVAPGESVVFTHSVILKTRAFATGLQPSVVKEGDFRVTGGVAGGGDHTVAVKATGELYAWGQQNHGRLGNNSSTSAGVPTPQQSRYANLAMIDDAQEVAGGFNHTLFVNESNSVFGFGNNSEGQVGDDTLTNRATAVPVKISSGVLLTDIIAVAAGSEFSLALSSINGYVYSWGNQSNGRLGNNQTTGRQRVAANVRTTSTTFLANIVQIAAGQRFALARNSANNIWSWGFNGSGQLGRANTTNSSIAVPVTLPNVIDIAAGYDHSVALIQSATEDRIVRCWGEQGAGRLGNGNLNSTAKTTPEPAVTKIGGGVLDKIIQVAAGPRHSVALDRNGHVWTWGHNGDGQLGSGNTQSRAQADRVLVAPAIPLDDIVYVSAGGKESVNGSGVTIVDSYTLALRRDGSLFSWGANGSGALGTGNTSGQVFAAPAAQSHYFSGPAPTTVFLPGLQPYYIAPANINLLATVAHPSTTGFTTNAVEFVGANTLIGRVGGPTFATTWQNVPIGNHPLRAMAEYASGAVQYSVPFTVKVLNPNADEDGDTLPNSWEHQHGLDPLAPNSLSADYDNDGFTDRQEYRMGMKPNTPFTSEPNGGGMVGFQVYTAFDSTL